MQKEKPKIWKNQLETSKSQTKICKICLKKIEINNFLTLLNPNISLCSKCLELFEPKFIRFEVMGYKALSIFSYDETIKSYLYQFKGCFDYELRRIFLERFYGILRIKYRNFSIIPAPSFIDDDNIRGYNHVFEIFKYLKLPIIKAIEKISSFKQADHCAKDREKIKEHLIINESSKIKGKRILIVDDVFTTGSTIKSIIELVKKKQPKEIQILVMSKTISQPIQSG